MAKDYMKKKKYRFFKPRQKKLNRSMAGNSLLFFVMAICGVFMALPLVMIINNCLKPLDEIYQFPPKIFVRNPTMENFTDLFSIMSDSWVPFSRYILNTIIITGFGTVGHVILASLAAYPLAKHEFPGKKLLFNMVVLSMMFSWTVTQIPNYMIISWLGINNNYLALILPACSYGMGLYLMKQFMEQIRISKDVLHSCKVSGEIRKLVKGLMIESYIEDGAQKVGDGCYGKSITDPCLGWEKTEKLIYELAELW